MATGTEHTYKLTVELTDGSSLDAGNIVVTDGVDGVDGTNGTDGKDGVGVASITLEEVEA